MAAMAQLISKVQSSFVSLNDAIWSVSSEKMSSDVFEMSRVGQVSSGHFLSVDTYTVF